MKIEKLLKNIKNKIKTSPPALKRFIPTEKVFHGNTLFIHDIASFELCNYELFVQHMYKFVAKTQEPFIIDCGANLGMSIIYFKELYPLSKIIAFEADDYIFSFLEKNPRPSPIANLPEEDFEVLNQINNILQGNRIIVKAKGKI